MHDLALHLCERVIPSGPLRQWVLTVPRALRFPLARDAAPWRSVVGITVRTISGSPTNGWWARSRSLGPTRAISGVS